MITFLHIILMNLWTAWPETYSIINNYTITIISCFIVYRTEVCYILYVAVVPQADF